MNVNDKIEKNQLQQTTLKKQFELTWINLLNLRPKSWDRDQFIDKKLWSPTFNRFSIEHKIEEKKLNPWEQYNPLEKNKKITKLNSQSNIILKDKIN